MSELIFIKFLLVFEVSYQPLIQRDAWKKLKLPKNGKGCLKLSFLLWLCELMESARTLNIYAKILENCAQTLISLLHLNS
jgi:hypothetical protein